MQITVNGKDIEVADTIDVAGLVASLGYPDRGVAVALDDDIVTRGAWNATKVTPKQRVEILTAVQGG